jgi:hypothetical protein
VSDGQQPKSSEHAWQRLRFGQKLAIAFGARLAQQMASARGQFQELRRREAEFVLRWPEVGVIQARDTWLQRRASVQQDDTLPEDARTTADQALADLRSTLAGMVVLLERAEGDIGDGAGKLRSEIGQLKTAARAALGDTSQHRQRLDKLVRLLEERGDARTLVPPLPAPVTPAAEEAARAAEMARPGRVAALVSALDALGLPLPTTEEAALRVAVERVAARVDLGLP